MLTEGDRRAEMAPVPAQHPPSGVPPEPRPSPGICDEGGRWWGWGAGGGHSHHWRCTALPTPPLVARRGRVCVGWDGGVRSGGQRRLRLHLPPAWGRRPLVLSQLSRGGLHSAGRRAAHYASRTSWSFFLFFFIFYSRSHCKLMTARTCSRWCPGDVGEVAGRGCVVSAKRS